MLADSASRIGHVSTVSWNHMDVQVRNSLARRWTGIETDIVTVRTKFQPGIENPLGQVHQIHHGFLLLGSGVEPGRGDALCNYQCVARRDRKIIEHREGQVV